mmetsp:Transcript_14373/g.30490  ORF Transcript_14373/g.30490 Transcript_14373/m.30490 type:complete len:218 (+) Transcript_14373:863-1516(+)
MESCHAKPTGTYIHMRESRNDGSISSHGIDAHHRRLSEWPGGCLGHTSRTNARSKVGPDNNGNRKQQRAHSSDLCHGSYRRRRGASDRGYRRSCEFLVPCQSPRSGRVHSDWRQRFLSCSFSRVRKHYLRRRHGFHLRRTIPQCFDRWRWPALETTSKKIRMWRRKSFRNGYFGGYQTPQVCSESGSVERLSTWYRRLVLVVRCGLDNQAVGTRLHG